MADPNLITAIENIAKSGDNIALALGSLVTVLWFFLFFKSMAGQDNKVK